MNVMEQIKELKIVPVVVIKELSEAEPTLKSLICSIMPPTTPTNITTPSSPLLTILRETPPTSC